MHLRTQLRLSAACLLICALLCTCGAWATGIQVDFLLAGLRHPDTDEPLTGGLVYSYAAGTSTAKALYTDAALTTPASNPVVLSAYGQANVYGSGKYKFVIKDADSVTLLTLDNLEYSSVSSYFADTTDPFGSSLTLTSLTVNNGLAATLSANLNAAGYGIASLATPTLSTSAANKGYVDDKVDYLTELGTGVVQISTYPRVLPSTATPTTAVEGILWYDNNTDKLKVYASGTWEALH